MIDFRAPILHIFNLFLIGSSRNPIMSQRIKEKLQDLEKKEIIRNGNSPYASPILLVAKGNGYFRLVDDYRKLD